MKEKSKIKQPHWNKYEVVLLIDTFLSVENGVIKAEDAKLKLSNTLRTYAINNGMQIDNIYI